MKKIRFTYMFMSLYVLLLLASCIGEPLTNELEPSVPLAPIQTTRSPLPTQTLTRVTASTAASEPIFTPTPEPSATVMPTAAPTTPVLLQPNATISPLICSQVISYVDIRQETNNTSWQLMDFTFASENVITFFMWSDRPYPGPTPTPITEPIAGGGRPVDGISQSRRVLLKGQTWDLNSGTLVERPVTGQQAMQNPCGQECPLEVIGIAPDNSWQLLQITDTPGEYQGLWLANQDTVTHLISYVPRRSQWQWSNDGRLLWLTYTLQDIDGETYAFASIVVDLVKSATPTIVFRSWDLDQSQSPNLLSPNEYQLVFSPVDKTVLSYKIIPFSEPHPPNNQLVVYHIDISQIPPKLLDTRAGHYPFLIDWNDTLQDFVVLQIDATGAVIYALHKDIVYQIPMEVIQQMPQIIGLDGQIRTDFSTEVDIRVLSGILNRIAISPGLQRVMLMDRTRAWAFSCSD